MNVGGSGPGFPSKRREESHGILPTLLLLVLTGRPPNTKSAGLVRSFFKLHLLSARKRKILLHGVWSPHWRLSASALISAKILFVFVPTFEETRK